MFSAHKVTIFFLTSNDFCKFFFVPTCISLPQRLSPYLSGVPVTTQPATLAAENEKYRDITEADALKMCLEDKVTDGKGLGFGLYTTSRLVDSIGKAFILHSGTHKLERMDGNESVIENGFWQGTLIYMVIGTGEEIDPNQIVDHRADIVEEYNETFVESSEIESLW